VSTVPARGTVDTQIAEWDSASQISQAERPNELCSVTLKQRALPSTGTSGRGRRTDRANVLGHTHACLVRSERLQDLPTTAASVTLMLEIASGETVTSRMHRSAARRAYSDALYRTQSANDVSVTVRHSEDTCDAVAARVLGYCQRIRRTVLDDASDEPAVQRRVFDDARGRTPRLPS